MLKVKIISGTVDPLYDISNAARMCTNTQDKNDIRTRESFVRARIRNGEENLLEHAYVQLEISGILRQLSGVPAEEIHVSSTEPVDGLLGITNRDE